MLCSWVQTGRRGVFLGLLALAFAVSPALAQTSRITGTVREVGGDPLPNARVVVVGRNLSATTNAAGSFAIENVPPGTYTLQANVVGYSPATMTNATVTAGLPFTANFELRRAVISLEEVVVTGVVGATAKSKLPFTVEQVKAVDAPVPQDNALTALQGKVAGAVIMQNTGQPGAAPTVLLRGATSINASGRSQEPLYVVDGVILGSSLVDIDALDIETIEIVKGAAAASLYGSRAASGVIQIRTRRGAGLPQENVMFTVRTEYGANRLPGEFDLTQHHQFLMTSDGSKFITSTGVQCDWLNCSGAMALAGQTKGAGTANEWNTYQDQVWPGQAYDQVKRFFQGGNVAQQYVAAEGRSGNTNFHASWTNLRQQGVMMGQWGESRNNFRLNVDQAIGKFEMGASAFYSRSKVDAAGGPLFNLTRMPAGVDLLQLNKCPATGTCKPWQKPRLLADGAQDPNDVWVQPDPFNNESPNPLYTILNDDNFVNRGRFLGSANARFQPFPWLSVDGQASYDRLDYKRQEYIFKGYKTTTPSASANNGNLLRRYEQTQAFNASGDVTLTHRFGDLGTRTQFRYLAEYDEYDFTQASGNNFAVADVPTIDNLNPTSISGTSGLQPIRSDGFFGITNFEFKDRYILDGLARNDGSSLFGPDARRQWYYRIAGAWRLGQDLRLAGVDELKLRAAYGTAGGRPSFTAQYETYSVSGGQVSPVTLGNKNLKPEFSKELETGVDLLVAGRIGLTVNYANTVTDDQILQVPLSGYWGFSTQWQNAGTLSSKTWEATLDLAMVQARNVTWTAKVLFDRTRSQITKLNTNVPPFTYGVGGQGLGDVFYARQGEQIGTFYGTKYATSCGDLLGAMSCDDFATNSDGFLVWVGPGGSLSNPQWGTQGPSFGFKGQTRRLDWGSPFVGWGVDKVNGDTTNFLPIGKTTPDFHVGFSNTLRVSGLSLYGLLEWTQGIDVYNQPQQWSIFKGYAGIMDQYGVPDAEKRPIGYYNRLYGIAGLRPVNYFVQDASFAKLREVSLSYRFSRDQLASIGFLRAFQGLSISVIGRNLMTFSSYNGYDPEVGRNGGDTGSAAIARVDGYDYPNFRTFTAALQVTF